MDILALLKERGFISAVTAHTAKHFNSAIDTTQESLNAAITASAKGDRVHLYAEDAVAHPPVRRVVYAGFDPTSDSLHMGNLLVIIALMHFHNAGHTVLPLVRGIKSSRIQSHRFHMPLDSHFMYSPFSL